MDLSKSAKFVCFYGQSVNLSMVGNHQRNHSEDTVKFRDISLTVAAVYVKRQSYHGMMHVL